MQCIILAAGEGTRLMPLTKKMPKPMVEVKGKPILEHILMRLPDAISEVIIVIGYKGNQIKKYFGDEWNGIPIKYVEQKERIGNADALYLTKSLVHGKFLLLNADDVLSKEALAEGVKTDRCMFASRHKHPEYFGVIETDEDGNLVSISEKPKRAKSNLVNTGAFVLGMGIFNKCLVKDNATGEYYLTDLVQQQIKYRKIKVIVTKDWTTVSVPEDIEKAEAVLD